MRFHLDHNATTPVDPRVLEYFLGVERTCPGNPSSLHRAGRLANAVVEDARERIAAALGGLATDVVFTSGGSEANNLAVHGLGDPQLPVLLGSVEHPSTFEPAQARGVELWSTDRDGRALITEPERAVGLICLLHGQSEVGSLQPLVAAAGLAQRLGVPLHIDAAQTLGRVPLHEALRVADSVTLSPHKAGGMRGVGVLMAREAAQRLRPLLRGGGQEHGLRPGTQSPSLCATAAFAIELAVREQPSRAASMAAARDALHDAILNSGADVRRITPHEGALPNTLMLHFAGVDGRALLPALDLAGIEASHGSACSAGAPTPPRVLIAMGMTEPEARACVRFSCASETHCDFASRAGAIVGAVVERLQKKN